MNIAIRNVLGPAVLALMLGVWIRPAYAQHEGDVWVGRSADGQLTLSPQGYVPELNYKALSPVSGLLKGWSDDDPGFDRITTADPENDIYPLGPGCAIWLEVVEMEPAFRLIDAGFQILEDPGDDTYLGGYDLHVHNTWHINSVDPAYDPQQCVWHATIVLRDDGSTGYADSRELTFSFTNVPLRAADGDFDENGEVDLEDYTALVECMAGEGVLPGPDDPAVTTCEVECLNAFDFDEDRDVDLMDFACFQASITQ